MKTTSVSFLFLSFLFMSFFSAANGAGIPGQLSTDATYVGIPLDRLAVPLFFETGELSLGKLKSNATINGTMYKGGTQIQLYRNGRVSEGTLQSKTTIGGLTYEENTLITYFSNGNVKDGTLAENANPSGKNLFLQKGMFINWNPNGTVGGVEVRTDIPAIFFGMNVKSARFAFDQNTDAYKLVSGQIATPTVVALIPTEFDNRSAPVNFAPIIAPTDSNFTFAIEDLGQLSPELTSWRISGKLTLSGQSLGYNPILYLNGMNAVRVMVVEDVIISGVTVKRGTTLGIGRDGSILLPK